MKSLTLVPVLLGVLVGPTLRSAPTSAKIERGMTVSQVYYAEDPAALTNFEKGNPVWQEVEDTHQLRAENTASWVHEDARTGATMHRSSSASSNSRCVGGGPAHAVGGTLHC